MANVYTRTGDKGTTGLVGGNRVSKSDPRVNCYGIIDEAGSMLGLAYATSDNQYVRDTIHTIQEKLFVLGAELASDEKGMERLKDNVIHEEDVKWLEQVVDHVVELIGKQHCFVVPGVNQSSAALHVARTIVRRAERALIGARDTLSYREEVYRYVNRLSDTLFMLARLEETEVEQEELKDRIRDIILESLGESAPAECGTAECCCCAGVLNLEVAKKLAEAAEKKAMEIGVPAVVTVVDNGGNLLLLHRMEDSFQGSIDISMNKAYTANAFHMPTDVLGKEAQPGKSLYGIQQTNQGRIVIFGGGFPLISGGKTIGAVGVSGGTEAEDMSIAGAAVKVFEAMQ